MVRIRPVHKGDSIWLTETLPNDINDGITPANSTSWLALGLLCAGCFSVDRTHEPSATTLNQRRRSSVLEMLSHFNLGVQ